MHAAVAEQLGKRPRRRVLALVLLEIPQHAEREVLGQVFPMRDLLHARARQQPPGGVVRGLVLLRGRVRRLAPRGQHVEEGAAGEADGFFGAPVLRQGVEEEDVGRVVFGAVEAVGRVVEHAEAQPGEDLRNVLHDGAGLDFEFPVEVAGLGVLEFHRAAEGDEGVFDDAAGVGAVFPEVDEEVVP